MANWFYVMAIMRHLYKFTISHRCNGAWKTSRFACAHAGIPYVAHRQMSRFRAKHSEYYIMSNASLTLEMRQEKSSEVIIPVLEHGELHVDSDRVSVLNIMIKIAISPGASLGP